ncbi:MAG: NAD(P)-dependent glycerol-1-phosphate dehydrogenase [Candidatus Odinarchaeia archaeon]
MSNAHKMQLPREVIVGYDILDEVVPILSKLNLKNSVLILTGETTKQIAGQRIYDMLKTDGFKPHISIVKKASIEHITQIKNQVKRFRFDVIIGVGGGKVIDVAKVIASDMAKPYISVPTSASHDGIVSPRASIKGAEKLYSIQTEAPLAIIADSEIIMKAPYRFLAAGSADLISNTTAVYDWKLSHEKTGEYYGAYAASQAELCSELIIKNTKLIRDFKEEGVRLVLESLISSGVAMAIAGSSRPASGSEHLFSHSLDHLGGSKALHGEQCGVGAIIMMYLQGRDWEKIRNALIDIKSPTTAKELGITDQVAVNALLYAPKIRKDRYTILNEVKLDKIKAEYVLKKVKVI